MRHVPCPPMHQDSPRFSTKTSQRPTEFAAVADVNESPTAAIMSISAQGTKEL